MWVLRRNVWVYDPNLSHNSLLNPLIQHTHPIIPLSFDDKNQVINFGVLTTDRRNKLDSVSTKIQGNNVDNQKMIFYRSNYDTVIPNIKYMPVNLRSDNYNSCLEFCINNPKYNIKVISPEEFVNKKGYEEFFLQNDIFPFSYGIKNTQIENFADKAFLENILLNSNSYLTNFDIIDDLEGKNFISKETASEFRNNFFKSTESNLNIINNDNE